MRLWVWRNIRIELPDDWEMLQFSRDPQAGRCAFADRYQFRAELSWQAVPGPPDMARLASDYLAKLTRDGTRPASPTRQDSAPEGRATAVSFGEWRGLRGSENGLATSRFCRYLAEESCIVELVLPWPEALDARLEEAVLGSVAAEPQWPWGLRRWRAFGMDLLASHGLALHECSVEPAAARMTFGDERTGCSETFQRLGMVSEWLCGTVRDWLCRQKPSGVAWASEASAQVNGHTIETRAGMVKRGLARRALRYEATAWLCPADGRLYCVSAAGSDGMSASELAGRRLACCGSMASRFPLSLWERAG
ncbi:MAG: hypothetical protein FJ291_22455 [Planctomycetes bacterium]|nr:hypothetical protein [Planctomycetota bacterium]